MRRILPSVVSIFLLISFSGCSMPASVSAVSWAIDGASYIATKKSLTDHGLSFVSGQDCALYRLITGMDVCQEYRDSFSSIIKIAEASALIENQISQHKKNEIFYSFDLQLTSYGEKNTL